MQGDEASQIYRHGSRIVLTGVLRMASRAHYLSLLDELQAAAAAADEVEIDCTQLKFLNSSCISTIAIWITQVRDSAQCKRVRFISNAALHTWQARWLQNLRKLWSGVTIVDRS